MRPACGSVCLCGYCIYIFPGNVKVSRSKEINISSFLTQYTTHELIVATALKELITVPSGGRSAPVHLCVPAPIIEPAFLTCPTLAYFAIFASERRRTQTLMHSHIHPWRHTQFSLFAFPHFYFFYQK